MSNTETVKAVLEHKARPAALIARRAGLPLDLTYQALVSLYDKGEAFIVRSYPSDRPGSCVNGWASA